ncbi:MAG: DegV family protein [Clostridiales bacterium]|nr:DegV family protein [Clostridiales bacterium]
MAEYRIMADATIDFPEEIEKEMDITIIPMTVEMGGTDYTICGKDSTISAMEFFDHLEKGEIARTAQVTTATFYQYFEEAFKEGFDVIHISFSSALSKSYEASVLCAEKMKVDYPDRKLYCIDSLCATAGHGLLVYTAVQKHKEGYTVDDLAEWIENNKLNVAHWVTVDELDTLLRGGRITRTSAALGTMLSIKPIIHVDGEGKLVAVNKVRGRKKSLEAMLQAYRENASDGAESPVFVTHGTAIQDAQTLRDMLIAEGVKNVSLCYVGPVIGAHTGPTVVTLHFFGDRNLR